jgi:hypothetical protein
MFRTRISTTGHREYVKRRGVMFTVFAVLLVGTSAMAVANKSKPHLKPHCAIPKRWRVLARDSEAVVIHKFVPGPDYPTISAGEIIRYCARPGTGAAGAGHFRPLARTTGCCYEGGTATTGPPTSVDNLTLSGPYIAYAADWLPRGGGDDEERIRIVNTHNATAVETGLRRFAYLHTLLLSASGVAAWLWNTNTNYPQANPSFQQDEIQSLVSRTGQTTILDSAPTGQLANLQIYQCVTGTGCSTAPLVIRWTNHGTQREATVQASGG